MPGTYDYNYINPEGMRPENGWKPTGFLGGMLYGADRKRYEDQASLQDLMTAQKTKEFVGPDVAVRQAKRGADIATSQGTEQTAIPRAWADLREKQLTNAYNTGTLGARMGKTITDSQKTEHDFNLQKLRDGLQLSTMLTQAMGAYGPAGAAAVSQTLAQRGIDVSRDPVANYVMSAPDHAQMQQRVQQVQQAFSMADQAHRTQLMQQQHGTTRQLIQSNAAVDVAYAPDRSAGSRQHDVRWQAYKKQVKLDHPNFSDAQVEAEAVRRMDAGQFGAQKPENTERRETEKVIRELEQMLPLLTPGTPIHTRMKNALSQLKAGRGAQGTPDNPIKLD